jgi:hypothetical protein
LQPPRTVHGVQLFLLELELFLISPQLDRGLYTFLDGLLVPLMTVVVFAVPVPVVVVVAVVVPRLAVVRLRIGLGTRLGLVVLGRLTMRRLGVT